MMGNQVTGTINAQPLSAIPSDMDDPQPLSTAMLITMKTRPLGPPPGNFTRLNVGNAFDTWQSSFG